MEQEILDSAIGIRLSDVQQALAVSGELDRLRAACERAAEIAPVLSQALALGPRALPNGPLSDFADLLEALLRAGADLTDGLRARALVQLGATRLLLGDAAASVTALYEAQVLAASAVDAPTEARAALALAYSQATGGDAASWRRAMERADKAIARADEPLLYAELAVACSWARRLGLDADAATDRGYALQRIADGCCDPDDPWNEGVAPKRTIAPPPEAVRIAVDGSWFEVSGERANLSRRPVLRRVLAALVAHHQRDGQEPINVVGLLQAGWPNERFVGDSGAARVYQTIKRLRQMGLGELLAHDGVGYWLKGAPEIEPRKAA